MTTSDNANAMRDLLGQQIEQLKHVLKLLEQEREALLKRDAAALEVATARKQRGLASIETLEKQRLALAPNLESMEDLAATPEVASRWETMLELTRRCREHNEENGRTIRRQQRRVESTLQLMRGNGGGSSTYGPDGDSPAEPSTRPPIASA